MAYNENEISELIGKTLKSVTSDNSSYILFETVDGEEYRMYHSSDCCESVYIESIVGDLQDLIGYPILMAEEAVNPEGVFPKEDYDESYTWTFYKLATVKGYVDIRWYGTSNGYYSESVSFIKTS